MWSLNHEITHQLGIIDNYQLDLSGENNKVNGKGFGQPDGGIMGVAEQWQRQRILCRHGYRRLRSDLW